MKKTLFVISIFIFFIKIAKCSFCGSGGWIAFADEKCFKFINRVVTREKAEQICNDQAKVSPLNFLPTLVSIKSQEEQQFLERYLFETGSAFNSVWISAKRKAGDETKFQWIDGSELDYNNWAEGNPTSDTNRKCVQMQSEYDFKNSTNLIKSGTVDKWVSIPCERSNLVVCEKLQTWSFPQLQKAFLHDRKQLNNLRQNPVPIGFIYVQLPSQPEPTTLWPTVQWGDVSSEYAGLFFRVLGGGAAPFGETQNENSPRIIEAKTVGVNPYDYQFHTFIPADNTWTYQLYTGSHGGHYGMCFKASSGEVRPRNKAMRIWKRIK